MTSDQINWGDYPTSGSTSIVDYRNKEIKYFVWETGSDWASQYNGFLDNLEIQLTDNSSIKVDLEGAPIPEPGTFILLGCGLIGLITIARKRSNRK